MIKLQGKKQKEVTKKNHQFSSVQSLSRVRLFATPWIAARQASLSITNSQSSLKLTFMHVDVWQNQYNIVK